MLQSFATDQNGSAGRSAPGKTSSLAKRSLAFSVVLHCALAVAIVVAGFFSVNRRKNEQRDVMLEFTVAVPPAEEAPQEAKAEEAPESPAPPAAVPDTSVAIVEKKPKTPPKPKFEKGKIVHRDAKEKKRTIVEKPKEKPVQPKPVAIRHVEVKGPKLSQEEIRKLLDAGARPSDRTSIPASERERCIALIYEAVKRAWICPDSSALSAREPEIEFSLGPGGSIGNVRLVKSSGNAALDQSVLGAAKAVRSVSGLSPAFIRANPRLTVAFSLEGA